MANQGVKVRLSDDDPRALDAVMDDSTAGGVMVDVLEALSKVAGDLYAGDPGGERGEVRVSFVAKAVGEGGPCYEVVNEVDAVSGKGSSEESDDAAVMALADRGEAGREGGGVTAKGTLEDDGVAATEGASPGRGGGRGDALGEKIVGGGGDLGEGEKYGFFREGAAEAGNGGGAPR